MKAEEIDKARGCSCLREIEEKLCEQVGCRVYLHLNPSLHREKHEYTSYEDLFPLRYKWCEKRKIHEGHIAFTHCPFCGTKRP